MGKTLSGTIFITEGTLKTYDVTLSVTNGTGGGTIAVEEGKSATFTITPSEGYGLVTETNTCGGTFTSSTYSIPNITSEMSCSISLKKLTKLVDQILADNPTVSTRSSFNSTFTSNTTGTIYTATEANVHQTTATTVYYYAGNTTNNWVKFAKDSNGNDLYWRIIRTNADGSVRLLYHGTSTSSTSAYIGSSSFNTSYTEPMYVGYMYGTSGSIDLNRNNTNNSTIKSEIDEWYENNLKSYANYFSTTAVYCNDRSYSGTYSTTNAFNYATYNRAYSSYSPTYDCTTATDAFSESNISAKLTYPIGLMTLDEIVYAGGKGGTSNSSAWYYQNRVNKSSVGYGNWWLLSPSKWDTNNQYGSSLMVAYISYVTGSLTEGAFFNDKVNSSYVVRPVVSILGTTLVSGSGEPLDPYIVN